MCIDTLLSRMKPWIWRVAGPRLGQDLFDEVCLRVCALREQHVTPALTKCIARRSLVDLLRRRKLRCYATLETTEASIPRQLVSTLEPWQVASRHEEIRQVRAKVACLSPKCKEAIEEVYFAERSEPDTARHLGIPLETLRTRLKLAKKQLRKRLKTGA